MTDPVYILTAQLDADSFVRLDSLRRAHFPPERNVLSAHLTMFHQLSPQQVARLCAVPLPSQHIPVQFDQVVFLGFGNALRATSPDLVRLRSDIKSAIGNDISRQDAQRWVPHITIQNRVTADAARALHATLTQDFQTHTGSIDGLRVWEYLGGPWRLARSLPFGTDDA